jgi:hypothetical protein
MHYPDKNARIKALFEDFIGGNLGPKGKLNNEVINFEKGVVDVRRSRNEQSRLDHPDHFRRSLPTTLVVEQRQQIELFGFH